MKKQIRKPENWQDFEELCKILWGEIWNCAEIKKNGRSGQNQHGVDIYGIPKGESKYFGIQCKGKDDYAKAELTQKEVLNEIDKAKKFKPGLQKLYFATTANKDERIEEFFRLKNIEQIQEGLFELHLFCWEDIAYLIDQNKRAHDWYIRKIDFASHFKIEVVLDNEKMIKDFTPILLKNHIKYKYEQEKLDLNNGRYSYSPITHREERLKVDTEAQPIHYYFNSITHNKSTCVFFIKLRNIGSEQLENFKLYLFFNDECYISEIVSKQTTLVDLKNQSYNLKWMRDSSALEFKTHNEILVQNDEALTDKICMRPTSEYPFSAIIPWKLVSKDFTQNGEIRIVFNTEIIERYTERTYAINFEDETILENYTDE